MFTHVKAYTLFIIIKSIGNIYNCLRLLCKIKTINMKFFYLLKCLFSYDTLLLQTVLQTSFQVKSNSPKPNFTGLLLFKRIERGVPSGNIAQKSTSHKMTSQGQISQKVLLHIIGKEIASSCERYQGFAGQTSVIDFEN